MHPWQAVSAGSYRPAEGHTTIRASRDCEARVTEG